MHSTEVFKGGNGVHYDLGKTIRVPIGSPWCINADESGRVGRVDFYCSERTALFMKAVSDAHALVCSAVEEGEFRNPLMRSLEELVEALRLDWEACYITEIAEREAAKLDELLDEHDAEPFSVKKDDVFIDPSDETEHWIKRVTEDGEYCTVAIWQMGGQTMHYVSPEAIRPVSYYRDLRKLV